MNIIGHEIAWEIQSEKLLIVKFDSTNSKSNGKTFAVAQESYYIER
jgi:hypothetical protein